MNEYDEYDKKEKIYRYLDFIKFTDLLSKLYFSRADMQNDKFEGSLSEVNMLQRKYMPYGFEEEETPEFYANLKKLFLISCWHRSSIESYAMWKIYSNDAQGVAIETTIDNLYDSFICNDEHLRKTPSDKWGKEEMLTHEIIAGNVIYYDGRYKDIPDGYPYKFSHFFTNKNSLSMKKSID